VKDIYTFTAAPGQQVFFDVQAHSGTYWINWKLTDANGEEMFSTCLGCTQPGVHTLTLGGTYTLTVGEDRDDSTGTYQFQLWDVPAPDEFSISIGDVVSDGNPGPGAGNIETPGVKDIYTFTVTPGQTVTFDVQAHSGTYWINWKLTDENDEQVFDTCLGCTDPGTLTLTLGGTYTITVGENRDDSTGTYQFQITG
jgi:hypothetical protein